MRLPQPLRKRNPQSHKYTYGHILAIGGSQGMSGAVTLAAEASLVAGAGLVTVAAGQSVARLIETKVKEIMLLYLKETSGGTIAPKAFSQIEEFVKKRKVRTIVLGNGMRTSVSLSKFCQSCITKLSLPVVVDADGLNNVALNMKMLRKRKASLIFTPHQGEFLRLCGRPKSYNLTFSQAKKLAQAFALEYNLVLVLKSHHTLVTDGKRLFENHSGNPGMATAGSGDVLAGIISAFVAQGVDLFNAAKFGVYLHSLAADLAVKDKGELSLIASDIIAYFPHALKSV